MIAMYLLYSRQGQGSRLNKVADLNNGDGPAEFGLQNGNNNAAKRTISVGSRNGSGGQENRARAAMKVGIPQPQVSRLIGRRRITAAYFID